MAASLRRWAGAAVLAAGAYALLALLGAAGYGYADNGDFAKYNRAFVAGPLGPTPGRPADATGWRDAFHHRGWHRYWLLRSGPGPAPAAGSGTTPWLWAAGRAVHRLVHPGPVLDLAYLGLLPRALVLLAALALAAAVALDALERRAWLPLLAVLPWPLLLTASATTAFFNSFYRETGTLVFAGLLITVLALAPRLRGWGAAAVLVAGALLVASAPVHGPLALIVAWATVDVARRDCPLGSRRRTVALGLGVVALLALGLWRPTSLDRYVREAAAFNALFLGALPHSDDAAGHLARLGLPADAERYVGRFAYHPEVRRWRAGLATPPTHRQVVAVVLREPRLAPRMLVAAAGLVQQTSVRNRNLDADDHPARRHPARWNAWGELAARWFPTGIGYLVAVAAAAAAGLVALAGADRARAATGRLLIVCAAASVLEVVVKYAGDGPTAAWRHLAAANFFFSAAVAAAFWLLLQYLAREREEPAREH